MFKPELLLPAGTLDSFFAALDGGADAVYAGVKRFNARNRAKNFTYDEISNMVREAHRQNAKVYITLNTLIKNEEIHALIETLHFVSQCKVDAIIIQDYAILNIAKKFFSNLEIHSSTQMGIHNSEGCNFLADNNIRRAILSRELNLKELNTVSEKSPIPIEIFVHGALCYSFSGQCMFSSYLGGFSANRGMCAQVCRRKFKSDGKVENIFSLKDLQLIDYVPTFSQYGVKSLKIEGRMKSPEYVYNTSKAYRSVIDDHSKVEEAKELLEFDFAREKTSWFIGKSLGDAITKNTGTGIFVGKIKQVLENAFLLESEIEILSTSKLRVRSAKDTETSFLKIETLENQASTYTVTCNVENLKVGDEIYLVGSVKTKLRTKFLAYQKQHFKEIGFKQKDAIKNSFKINRVQNSTNKLYVRISDPQALKKINLNNYDGVFLKLKFADLEALERVDFNADQKAKLVIELPKYISELKLTEYKQILRRLGSKRFKNFALSHLSQIGLLPEKSIIYTNENVYLLNDISINFVQSKGIKNYCYPLENDYPNLIKGRDRKGIIPIYYHPELFFSRMPVHSGKTMKDESGKDYLKTVIDGFTIVTDDKPVSFTHNINKFKAKGFSSFLIDISVDNDTQKLEDIVKSYRKSEKIQGTSDFNMKKGLR